VSRLAARVVWSSEIERREVSAVLFGGVGLVWVGRGWGWGWGWGERGEGGKGKLTGLDLGYPRNA